MEYFVYNVDEYQPLAQGNKFAPVSPFRMAVAGGSDSGKTGMLLNLLMGNKKADNKNGSRYILCNDVVLFAKFPDEPKWKIVQDFYNELANPPDDADPGFYEDVSFKVLPYSEIPDPDEFDPIRSTVAVFEDLMHESKKIQDKIAQYFTHGRHRNISSIYVVQRFFALSKTIRDNVSYISLHRGGGNLYDIKNILTRYRENSDHLASTIDDLTSKQEFIIFDLRRSKTDPLSIRIRWDRPLCIQDANNSMKLDDCNNSTKLDDCNNSINIVDTSAEPLVNLKKKFQPLNKFSIAGQEAIAQAKRDGHLVEFARNFPSPIERKKLLADGVVVKNSDAWAKFVYREAFDIKNKDLGIRWREFDQARKGHCPTIKIKECSAESTPAIKKLEPDKSSQSVRYQELLDSRPLNKKNYIEGCKILTWLLSNDHIDQKIYQVGIKELGLPH